MREGIEDILAKIVALAIIIAVLVGVELKIVKPIVDQWRQQQATINSHVRACIQETDRDYQTCYFMVTGHNPNP